MSADYTVKTNVAGDEYSSYTRSRIEAILENMNLSGGGTPSGDNVTYQEITSEELAEMWGSPTGTVTPAGDGVIYQELTSEELAAMWDS